MLCCKIPIEHHSPRGWREKGKKIGELPKSRRTYFQWYDVLRWDINPFLLKILKVGQHYG